MSGICVIVLRVVDNGGVAERLIAPVLKTDVPQGTARSNRASSAKQLSAAGYADRVGGYNVLSCSAVHDNFWKRGREA